MVCMVCRQGFTSKKRTKSEEREAKQNKKASDGDFRAFPALFWLCISPEYHMKIFCGGVTSSGFGQALSSTQLKLDGH